MIAFGCSRSCPTICFFALYFLLLYDRSSSDGEEKKNMKSGWISMISCINYSSQFRATRSRLPVADRMEFVRAFRLSGSLGRRQLVLSIIPLDRTGKLHPKYFPAGLLEFFRNPPRSDGCWMMGSSRKFDSHSVSFRIEGSHDYKNLCKHVLEAVRVLYFLQHFYEQSNAATKAPTSKYLGVNIYNPVRAGEGEFYGPLEWAM